VVNDVIRKDTGKHGYALQGVNIGEEQCSANKDLCIKLVTKSIKSDSFTSHFANHCRKGVKPTSNELRKNDESQNCLARKHDKLHEIVWENELFIVYVRKNRDSMHSLSGGMENHKPLQ
jgi:hypothetical protein